VKELHGNGIEVMLDVVFKPHRGGERYGPTIHYRGIDKRHVLHAHPRGYYYNFSGTGNTLNCNNPIVRDMVLESLRYWLAVSHRRLPLRSRLDPRARPPGSADGQPSAPGSAGYDRSSASANWSRKPGMRRALPGRLLPGLQPLAEWNGKCRDAIRKFLQGEPASSAMSQVIQGSPDLYSGRGTTASINFVTCHDGFTLYDLVAYNGSTTTPTRGQQRRRERQQQLELRLGRPHRHSEVNALRGGRSGTPPPSSWSARRPDDSMGDEVGGTRSATTTRTATTTS